MITSYTISLWKSHVQAEGQGVGTGPLRFWNLGEAQKGSHTPKPGHGSAQCSRLLAAGAARLPSSLEQTTN